MMLRGLLVDFENVQKMDLAALPEDFRVTIFVGYALKTLPFELVQGTQPLGSRLKWVRVEGNGNNALNFFIAYYLDCCFTQNPDAHYYILSKDTGFDPLVHHLCKKGRKCRRIDSLQELAPKPKTDLDTHYKLVIEKLGKMPKNGRPRKRTTLASHISALFQAKLPKEEVARLIDLLLSEGKVQENNQTLSYTF